MAKKKTNWNLMMSILFLLVIVIAFILFFVGMQKGWFVQQTFIPIDNATRNGVPGITPSGVDLLDNCDEVCALEGYSDGWDALFDDGHDCAMVGAAFVEYGYAGEDPLLSCCCDNIPDEPEGYEEGDNVGSGSGGSGNGNFGDDFIASPIILDWTTGGPYILGARIIRTWDYVDSQCEYTMPQQYPVEWTLYDSNGMAWQKYDYVPVNGALDYVCPLTYHEDAPWKFVVSVGIQECEIEYSWILQPYICEVLD